MKPERKDKLLFYYHVQNTIYEQALCHFEKCEDGMVYYNLQICKNECKCVFSTELIKSPHLPEQPLRCAQDANIFHILYRIHQVPNQIASEEYTVHGVFLF
jgi:hypothetical protein